MEEANSRRLHRRRGLPLPFPDSRQCSSRLRHPTMPTLPSAAKFCLMESSKWSSARRSGSRRATYSVSHGTSLLKSSIASVGTRKSIEYRMPLEEEEEITPQGAPLSLSQTLYTCNSIAAILSSVTLYTHCRGEGQVGLHQRQHIACAGVLNTLNTQIVLNPNQGL